MRDNSFVLFKLKLYVICTKRADQSTKFWTFDCSHEILLKLYSDRLLLWKVCKNSSKKSIEELCLMTVKSDAKLKKTDLLSQKR